MFSVFCWLKIWRKHHFFDKQLERLKWKLFEIFSIYVPFSWCKKLKTVILENWIKLKFSSSHNWLNFGYLPKGLTFLFSPPNTILQIELSSQLICFIYFFFHKRDCIFYFIANFTYIFRNILQFLRMIL